MCVFKKPKVATATTTEAPVLTNSNLDGLAPLAKAKRTGMSSLRINKQTQAGGSTNSLTIR